MSTFFSCSSLSVLDEMPQRDITTYNSLISGFALGGRAPDALTLFHRLPTINDVDIVAALSACAHLGSLQEASTIHDAAHSAHLDTHIRVRNALIDAYGKCGSVDQATNIFNTTSSRNRTLVSWNVILMALAMRGRGTHALHLWDSMAVDPNSPRPDTITYLAILCACVHAGLVDEGLRIFRSMQVPSTMKHYNNIVDLLGREGRLSDACDVISSMSFPADTVIWQTLLGACSTHGNMELAGHAAQELHQLGSNNDGDYVLISNLYAAKELWSGVGLVRDAMRGNAISKIPGFSYIEVDGVHRFLNRDREHRRSSEIYGKLAEVAVMIVVLGYRPVTSYVLHDIGEEDKEVALSYHNEKLAIAFGLIATPVGTPIQVTSRKPDNDVDVDRCRKTAYDALRASHEDFLWKVRALVSPDLTVVEESVAEDVEGKGQLGDLEAGSSPKGENDKRKLRSSIPEQGSGRVKDEEESVSGRGVFVVWPI